MCLSKLVVLESQNLTKKGKEFLDVGRYDEALEYFEQALSLSQNDPELWNLKGITLRSIGRYDEASECFNMSLKIDPRDRHSS